MKFNSPRRDVLTIILGGRVHTMASKGEIEERGSEKRGRE